MNSSNKLILTSYPDRPAQAEHRKKTCLLRNRQVSSFQVRPEGQYPHQYVDRATLMRRLLPYLESNHSMTGRPLSTYFLDFLSMTEKNEEKVLTDGSSCGNITLALNSTAPTESDARVVELVDSLASGASARKGVRVRLPPRAPNQYNPNLFPIGNGFGLFVFFERYENTHFRNGVQRKPTSKPRGPRKKKSTQ